MDTGLVMDQSNEGTEADALAFRPRLLALAYRVLGSAADAEDAVQDAYLRLHQAREVDSPEAWLVKATTRLCIDRLRQARRREGYRGAWLPEPIPEAWEGGATDRVELAESLSMAFLVLLETLSPAERAAYLLREVFDYGFDEIAALLDKTPTNVRQIAARARKRVVEGSPRFRPEPREADDLAARFLGACRSGDLALIESMIAPEAVYHSDGGGKAFAAPRPIVGRSRIANLLAVVYRKSGAIYDVIPTTVNGQPGVMFSTEGRPYLVTTFASEAGLITDFYTVLNPDKLRHWTPAGPSSTGVAP